jgi:hypothetical protein
MGRFNNWVECKYNTFLVKHSTFISMEKKCLSVLEAVPIASFGYTASMYCNLIVI